MYDAKIGDLKNVEIASVIKLTDSVSKNRVYLGRRICFNELLFRISGSNETNFNGKILINTPNTVEFLPKIDSPITYSANIYDPGKCIDVFFSTESPISKNPFVLNFENDYTGNLFFKLEKIWAEKRNGYYLQAMSVFYEILYEMKTTEANFNSSSLYKTIKPAEEYIHANYCNKDITIQLLADLCGISYSYFKRIFAQKYGTTPIKYITNLKIKKACELLSINSWNISQVSAILGFDNVYYFSKVFKDNVGCSPSEYIKKKNR